MPNLLDRVNATRARVTTPAETRTIGGVPWRPWDNPYLKFDTGGPLHPSRQMYGVDSALRLAPVYACARIIADGISSLPLRQYFTGPDGAPVRWGGPSWLDSPSSVGTLFDWLWQGTASAVLQGNALGLITGRDGYGYPTGCEWLPYEWCDIIDPADQVYNPLRAEFYYMGRRIDREDLIHLRAFTVPGRTAGISPLRAFASLISQGTHAVDYGTRWFEKGGFPPGVFQNHELEVGKDEAREIRRTLVRTIQAGEPLVYGRDWDYKPISVPPSEAQFIEAMQMNATQIAAVYGIPPERVGGARGDSLTYSTQEQETISLVTDTLRPWMVRWESVLNPLTPNKRYCKFDADAMIRTDIKTRHEVYKIRRDMGMETIDEIRRHEDMGPLGDSGDGTETLPLEVLVAMARGMKAIPKSMENLIDLAAAPTPGVPPTATLGGNSQAAAAQAAAQPAPGSSGSAPASPDDGGQSGSQESDVGAGTSLASLNGGSRPPAMTAARLRMIRARYGPELMAAAVDGQRSNGNGSGG